MNKTPAELREELKRLACETIDAVMDYGETTHTPGSWAQEGVNYHAASAAEHLRPLVDEMEMAMASRWLNPEDEAAHALCRAAMAVWSLRHGVLGDNGEEGKGE